MTRPWPVPDDEAPGYSLCCGVGVRFNGWGYECGRCRARHEQDERPEDDE
jgi:hypothetical protein